MKKVFIILVSVLVFSGVVIAAIGMSLIDFDLSKLNNTEYIQKKYDISDSFTDINIQTILSDVEICLSSDGECKIESNTLKNISQDIYVEGNTLNIIEKDMRKWYERIGIFWGDENIKVYLPEKDLQNMNLNSNTGKFKVSKDFSFNSVAISTNTGDIELLSDASEIIDIETDTGDISISDIKSKKINLESDTGKIIFLNAQCINISVQNDTGDIKLDNVIAENVLKIESDTGDVDLLSCDADSINIETDTGDVSGTILSEKVFITETDTGYISVPKTFSGGNCYIITSTGDIDIKIKGQF